MATDNIYDALRESHERQRSLCRKLVRAKPGTQDRISIFKQLHVELAAHAAAEERFLYAAMLADAELRHDAQHSVAEHKEIEDFLTELFEMDFSSTGWLTRFRTMKERYLHHIDEEEEEMFPEAEKGLSDAKKRELAAIFEREKPREKAKAAEDEPSREDAKD